MCARVIFGVNPLIVEFMQRVAEKGKGLGAVAVAPVASS